MSISGNRAASKVGLEIAVSHKAEVIGLSDDELIDYVTNYIEDWSTENRERFVNQIILEIKDWLERLSSINDVLF